MAIGPGVIQGKTAFAEQYLKDHPDATRDSANEAWASGGHEGTLSESLWQKARARLGLTGRRGSNGETPEEAAATSIVAVTGTSPKADGRGTSHEKSSPQPAHGKEHDGQSKSAFIGEVLGREPEANLKKVNEAWASAGHEGQISPSVYYKIKRERLGKEENPPVPSKSEPDLSHPGPSTPKAEKPTKPAKAAAPDRDEAESSEPTHAQVHGTEGHGPELHRIEGEIDELMFRLKGLGSFADVQDALRTARRLLVRSHPH